MRDMPDSPTQLNKQNVNFYLSSDIHVGLGFVLSLLLRQQFEDTRKMPAVLQRHLARKTLEKISTAHQLCERWTLCLRILDGLFCEQASSVECQIQREDISIDYQIISRQARQRLGGGGYLDLLTWRGISGFADNPLNP